MADKLEKPGIKVFETLFPSHHYPAGNNMFKVNDRNTKTRCEICSKLTIKTPEWRRWHRSGVFIVSFEHISLCSSVSIVNFEQVNAKLGSD